MAYRVLFLDDSNRWQPVSTLFGADRKIQFYDREQSRFVLKPSAAKVSARQAFFHEQAFRAAQEMGFYLVRDPDRANCWLLYRSNGSYVTGLTRGLRQIADEYDDQMDAYQFAIQQDDNPLVAVALVSQKSVRANQALVRGKILDGNTVGAGQSVLIVAPGSLFFPLGDKVRIDSALGFTQAFAEERDGVVDVSPAVQVSTGVSRGGGGAMRCDNLGEAEYAWYGNAALAKALKLGGIQLRQLHVELLAAGPITDPHYGLHNFWVTNLPTDARMEPLSAAASAAQLASSELLYFKRFKTGINKKNEPQKIVENAAGAADAISLAEMQPLIRRFSLDKIPSEGAAVPGRKKRKGQTIAGTPPSTTGEPLANTSSDREEAAAVMGISATRLVQNLLGLLAWTQLSTKEKQAPVFEPLQGLSGTARAAALTEFQTQWRDQACGVTGPLPFSQEWCHLLGHGDGGQEVFENFISGSKHCNSEQLAIESGQRKGGINRLRAKITVYKIHPAWEAGRFIRYKIYAGQKKIFDHLFDAQSKSLDYNEFKILKTTVERVVSANGPYYGVEEDFYTADFYAARINLELQNQWKKESAAAGEPVPELRYEFSKTDAQYTSQVVQRQAKVFAKPSPPPGPAAMATN